VNPAPYNRQDVGKSGPDSDGARQKAKPAIELAKPLVPERFHSFPFDVIGYQLRIGAPSSHHLESLSHPAPR
jgi:hypothetical protein